MATLVGVLMVVSGIAVLAVVRPWRSESAPDDDRTMVIERVDPKKSQSRPGPMPKRPRPRPGRPPSKRHRVEMIPRGRRVPPEPGREEILLPEWLGPVSGPR